MHPKESIELCKDHLHGWSSIMLYFVLAIWKGKEKVTS